MTTKLEIARKGILTIMHNLRNDQQRLWGYCNELLKEIKEEQDDN